VLFRSTGNNNDNQAEAGRLGLRPDLQKALRAHMASVAVQEAGCRAVRNMTANKNNKVEAGRLGLLTDLQKAMQTHVTSAAVQEAANDAEKSLRAIKNILYSQISNHLLSFRWHSQAFKNTILIIFREMPMGVKTCNLRVRVFKCLV